MGRKTMKITVTMNISNHNDDQDDIDEALVDVVRERIEKIVKEEKYEDIFMFLDDGEW